MTFGLLDYTPGYGQRRRRRNLQQIFIDSQGGFIISDANPACASVSPATLSPVVNSNYLTFTLGDYTNTLVASELSVVMENIDDATVRRTLNVVSVDDTTKTFTVKFPGAASGTYGFKVRGKNGSISCPVTIETIMEVTSYTPAQGSRLGGTLVTIDGKHFSTVATDNPVKVGDNYCYVQETSDTQIVCRIGDLDTQPAAADVNLLVFARTTEEM